MTAPSTPALPQMTLRQWYAGQALVGMLSSKYVSEYAGPAKTLDEFANGIAARAAHQADAMIAALKETGDA